MAHRKTQQEARHGARRRSKPHRPIREAIVSLMRAYDAQELRELGWPISIPPTTLLAFGLTSWSLCWDAATSIRDSYRVALSLLLSEEAGGHG